MKIIWVAGARPNFMKIAPIWKAMAAWNADRDSDATRFAPLLVHTGQHYDANMSDVFFRDLALPGPNYALGVGSGAHAEQTGRVMMAFERILQQEKPDAVGVVGDVNSTCACALTTAKSYVLPGNRAPLLIHVEAGLRSGDRLMPEEINRLVTDALADVLFTTEESGTQNLLKEGIPPKRIHFVGNVMVDSLMQALERDQATPRRLEPLAPSTGYGLVTLHRPSNVDDPTLLADIIAALQGIGQSIPLYMPIHPRTRAQWADAHMIDLGSVATDQLPEIPGLYGLPPLGYHDFLALMRQAAFVITDSGGVQEESTVLGVPCLTLRENTERPITVSVGTNVLLGRNPQALQEQVNRIRRGEWKKGAIPPGWDGHAAERIIAVLAKWGTETR
ncbi:MAG: UDP-N-acetylglucosamine 2-epimerase (non-hydrolyzing) [Candidatus Competibacter sp.]|nr:UDP-N-acetylglucosamine 2-epimerase (non-hydrolyzing) [Candidatus Competibacter sp.]